MSATLPATTYADFLGFLQEAASEVNAFLESQITPGLFKPDIIAQEGVSYLRRGGKRLRPAVLMLAAEAVGGQAHRALPAAAAVELFHTWTLVHDDVIDNDDLRRGQPTVHIAAARYAEDAMGLPASQARKYGSDVAILVGDVQHGWSVALLADQQVAQGTSPAVALRLISALQTHVLRTLLHGEMLDVDFSLRKGSILELSEEDITQMLWMKTGVLYAFCGMAGAMIGKDTADARDPEVVALQTFCSNCGTAFQMRDDILGIVGTEAKLGKPVGSDIREGKKTLIVRAALLNANDRDRAQLTAILGKQDATDDEVARATRLLLDNGGVDYVHDLAVHYIEEAWPYLDVLPDTASTARLRQWAQYLIERVH